MFGIYRERARRFETDPRQRAKIFQNLLDLSFLFIYVLIY